MHSKESIKRLIPQEFKNYYHYIQAVIAVLRYKYPAAKIKVVGVTGTDGKTTTSTLIYHFLKSKGLKVALVSSVAAYIGEQEIDTGFHVTTPDFFALQKLLRKIVEMKTGYLVLETTSHGLDQHRVLGTNIKIAVLTNITNEHLDYHKTYLNYVRTKAKIFNNAETAIINKADKSFDLVKKYIKPGTKIEAYDLDTPPLTVRTAFKKRFPENYNQMNATAAYLAAKELGVDDITIIKSVGNFPGVPGRMEEIKNNRGFRIIVDFAHTPNALESVLKTLKSGAKKGQRLISVFGCASERDETKRPVMGRISTDIADFSVFTAEDPRFEDINKILSEIEDGIKLKSNTKKYFKVPERGEAIYFAINKIAKKGDIIVICGKGHEKSMNYKGTEYPWSDKRAVEEALRGKVLKIRH